MKLSLKALLLVVLVVCFSIAVNAQDLDTLQTKGTDISIEIPPLSVLLDSAYLQDAMVRYRDQDVLLQNCNLKSDKTYWLRNIGVQTDVRYGTFDHFTTNASDGEVPVNTAMTSSEFRYGFGAYIRLPLVDAINRKNQIKMGKLEVEKAQSMAETQREIVRQQVIRQYNDLFLRLRLFKIKVKQFETARINMQMAEKEFVNGIIPVTEYARLSDIYVGVESNYEIAKTDLLTTLMLLEDLTGMKFKVNQSFL
jgi:outer membrane protein TolC